MEKRERRRLLSYGYASRAQREHLAVVHRCGAIDCVCERSVGYFTKRKSLGCGCRRRAHGRPKVGTGCHGGNYRESVAARSGWRRVRELWLAMLRCCSADDVEL